MPDDFSMPRTVTTRADTESQPAEPNEGPEVWPSWAGDVAMFDHRRRLERIAHTETETR